MTVKTETINIYGKSGKCYTFDGPYYNKSTLEDKSGVYAIIDARSSGNVLVDVGESATVKTRVENHDREPCWSRKRQGTIKYAVLYTPNLQQSGRMQVEQDIRDNYANLCGDR